MVLPTGGRKPGIPGQSRNELADRILGLGGTLEPIPGQVADLEAFKERADPGESGTAGRVLAWNDPNAVPFWQKRRYILVDDYTDAGGTVQDALNAVPSSGADVVFRADGSSYPVPNAGLTVKANTRITPMGSKAARLTAPAGASGNAVMSVASVTGVRIEGLDIDCNNHATMVRGLSVTHNTDAHRDIAIEDVIVRNALSRGIWVWRSNGIHLTRIQAYDCEAGILVDDVEGIVRIISPRVINTVAGRMRFGIRISSGSDRTDTAGAEIIAPYVSGADFATVSGAEAIGIAIANCPGARIVGGEILNCGNAANGLGGGVLFAQNSHFGQIDGTYIHDLDAPGIWQEVVPSGDITLGSDTSLRGVSARGVRIVRATVGVSTSYGAGSHLEDVWAIDCEREGFITDSENVTYIGCKVVNPWSNTEASVPVQNDGVRAGFRAYGNTGAGFRNAYSGAYIGCDAIDNRTTQLMEYGFAAEDRGYRFVGNLADGLTGGYYGGTSNNKFDGANSWE